MKDSLSWQGFRGDKIRARVLQIETRARFALPSDPRREISCSSEVVSSERDGPQQPCTQIRTAPTISDSIAAIKECGSAKDLARGTRIHAELRSRAMIHHSGVASSLVDMYGRCGSVRQAREIFDAMANPSLSCWNSIVMAYAQSGHGEEALELFSRMQERGLRPDARTFVAALKACAVVAEKEKGGACSANSNDPRRRRGERSSEWWLDRGIDLHSQLRRLGCEADVFVATTLVDMYAKCGSLARSREVFERMETRNAVAWNAIILGYAHAGLGSEALKLFARMQHEGTLPDSRTFVAAVTACTSLMVTGSSSLSSSSSSSSSKMKLVGLARGLAIHDELQKLGLVATDTFVGNSLVGMYSKLGRMSDARRVFDGMRSRSLVSWNMVIDGYGQSGDGEEALEMFSRMRDDGFQPDAVTFIAVINACALLASREQGEIVGDELVKPVSLAQGTSLHSQVGRYELENTFVANALVNMYAKCGSLFSARRVFDRIRRHSVVSWNSMIAGYAQGGNPETALKLVEQMRDAGFQPDGRTYLAVINAIASLERGMETHARLTTDGFESDRFVASALVDMYARCGSMEDAQRVFDRMPQKDSVCWTVLILGYAQACRGDNVDGAEKALQLLSRMQEEGYTPNAITYAAALNACTSLTARDEDGRCLEKAVAIHSQLSKSGCESDVLVAGSLVELYCKCGSLVDAQRVFDRMKKYDVVSLTSLMLGYVHREQGKAALDLFLRMQKVEGLVPDVPTFAAALKACGSSGALDTGRVIHQQICNAKMDRELVVVSSLVGFYGRCGSMKDARAVFDSSPQQRDSVTWNALIASYGHQGDVESVFTLFDKMLEEHWQPDSVTFLSLLTACCHAGLVEKGKEVFRFMVSDYAIVPAVEHYTCMVDLLGRVNQLDEALAVLKSIPVKPDLKLWMTVLDACGKWNNLEVGRLAFKSIQQLDEKDSAAYVLISKTYQALEASHSAATVK